MQTTITRQTLALSGHAERGPRAVTLALRASEQSSTCEDHAREAGNNQRNGSSSAEPGKYHATMIPRPKATNGMRISCGPSAACAGETARVTCSAPPALCEGLATAGKGCRQQPERLRAEAMELQEFGFTGASQLRESRIASARQGSEGRLANARRKI